MNPLEALPVINGDPEGEMAHSESVEIRLEPEFRDLLEILNENLEKWDIARLLRFGCEYNLSTASGERVKISSVYVEGLDPIKRKGREIPIKMCLLLEQDSQERVVGMADLTFSYEGGECSVSKGFSTGLRKKGFARPLINTAVQVIQEESNQLGRKIDAPIINGNGAILDQAKTKYANEPTTDNLRELETRADEHARWQALFGGMPQEFIPQQNKPNDRLTLSGEEGRTKILELMKKVKTRETLA